VKVGEVVRGYLRTPTCVWYIQTISKGESRTLEIRGRGRPLEEWNVPQWDRMRDVVYDGGQRN